MKLFKGKYEAKVEFPVRWGWGLGCMIFPGTIQPIVIEHDSYIFDNFFKQIYFLLVSFL